MKDRVNKWADIRNVLLSEMDESVDVNATLLVVIEADLFLVAQALAVIADKGEKNGIDEREANRI